MITYSSHNYLQDTNLRHQYRDQVGYICVLKWGNRTISSPNPSVAVVNARIVTIQTKIN